MAGPFIELTAPDTLPGSQALDPAWSPDDNYLAVGSFAGEIGLYFYKRVGDALQFLQRYDANTTCWGSIWRDDRTLYSARNGSNGLAGFKREGDTLVPFDLGPVAQGIGTVLRLALDPSKRYLACSLPANSNGNCLVFELDENGVPVSSIRPPGAATTQAQHVAWSPDGRYLAVPQNWNDSTPGFTVWKREGNNFTRLNVSTLNNHGYGVAFSPDGRFFLVSGPFGFVIYQRSGDNFTSPRTDTSVPNTYEMIYSRDGRVLAVIAQNAFRIYDVDPSTHTLTHSVDLFASNGGRAEWSASGRFLSGSRTQPPSLRAFRDTSWSTAELPAITAAISAGSHRSSRLQPVEVEIVARLIYSTDISASLPSVSASGSAELTEHEWIISPPFLIETTHIDVDVGEASYSYEIIADEVWSPDIPIETLHIDVEIGHSTSHDEVPGIPYLYSFCVLPSFSAEGEGNYTSRAKVDARFPALRTSGLIKWPLELQAEIVFPHIRSQIDVEVNLIGVWADFTLPSPVVTLNAHVPLGVITDLRMPAPRASGSVSVPLGVLVDARLPSTVASGTVGFPGKISAEITLPKLLVAAYADNPVPDHYDVLLTARMPAPQATVEVDMPLWFDLDARLPSVRTTGDVDVPLVLLGDLTLGVIRVSGSLGATVKIDANVTLPELRVDSAGGYPIDGQADLILPSPEAQGHISIFYSLRGHVILPALTASASLALRYSVAVDARLQGVESSARLRASYRLLSDPILPDLSSDGFVRLSYGSRISATLPRLSALVLVNSRMNVGSGIRMGAGLKGTFSVGSTILFGRADNYRIG